MDYPKNYKEKRKITDRRKFTYTAYFPERRCGVARRKTEANQIVIKVA